MFSNRVKRPLLPSAGIRVLLAFSAVLALAWVPPSQRYGTPAAPAADQAPADDAAAPDEATDIPSKWYNGARGYEDALELQKQTQADIFIYFVRPNQSDEKGLCKWFEDKGVKSLPVRRLLRGYLKVKVPLPANPRNQDLAEKFRVNKTPAVYVVQATGWQNRCTVFHWDQKPIKLLTPEELEEHIRLNSSEKYRIGLTPATDTE